ncbi:MAG TPA: PH domain-containing protein [Thermomicrobiales bacterium]|nr:PH domain-containing protein [Thermomicrobiales bacterium]
MADDPTARSERGALDSETGDSPDRGAMAGSPVPEPARASIAARGPAVDVVIPPRRLHPAWTFIHLVRSIRGFLLPLIIVFFTGGQSDVPFLAIAGAAAVLGLIATAASWWVFRYEVAEGELRVHSGLISRQERSVPLERIQAIDIGESLLQRIFGVVRVKVETAAGGGKGSDVTLEALSRADATDLANRLRLARGRGVEGASPAQLSVETAAEGAVIKRLSTGDLLLAGATSGRVGPALAIVGGAFQFADDIMPERVWGRLSQFTSDVSVQGIVVGLLVIGLIAWLFAITSTVLTFGGFTLRRDGDHLLISAGLLDRRRSTIPLSRIQAITISEGMLRQPFGLAALRIESAGYGADVAESGVLFPLIRFTEIPDLLARATPEMAAPLRLEDPRWQRLPDRARLRYALAPAWRVIPLVIAAVWAAVELPISWWSGLAMLVGLPLAIMYGLLQYGDTGWLVDDQGRLLVRGRTIARWTAIMPRQRIQRRSMTRSPFQRRAGLATFHAAVASGGTGGRVIARHLDESQADHLLTALGSVSSPKTRVDPIREPLAV